MRRVRFLPMRKYRPACYLTVAVLLTAACSDSSGPKAGGPRIRLISGSNVTDTAVALLKAALVVEVRDSSGAVAPQGTVVRFTTALKNGATPAHRRDNALHRRAARCPGNPRDVARDRAAGAVGGCRRSRHRRRRTTADPRRHADLRVRLSHRKYSRFTTVALRVRDRRVASEPDRGG